MTEIPTANYISASMTKKRLSSLVRRVMAGESFIITDDTTGESIAELVPDDDEDFNAHENEI